VRLHGFGRAIGAVRDGRRTNPCFPLFPFFLRLRLRRRFEAALDQFDQGAIGDGEVLHILENGPAIGRGLPFRLCVTNAIDGIEQGLASFGERVERALAFAIGKHEPIL